MKTKAGYYYSIRNNRTNKFVAYGGPFDTEKQAKEKGKARKKKDNFTNAWYELHTFFRSK